MSMEVRQLGGMEQSKAPEGRRRTRVDTEAAGDGSHDANAALSDTVLLRGVGQRRLVGNATSVEKRKELLVDKLPTPIRDDGFDGAAKMIGSSAEPGDDVVSGLTLGVERDDRAIASAVVNDKQCIALVAMRGHARGAP
jgi:hypothetical protein